MNNFQCYTFLIRDGKGTPVWFYKCFILSSAIKKKTFSVEYCFEHPCEGFTG